MYHKNNVGKKNKFFLLRSFYQLNNWILKDSMIWKKNNAKKLPWFGVWRLCCQLAVVGENCKMFGKSVLLTQILVLFSLCSPIFAEWNTRDYVRREHSLTKPYQGEWPVTRLTLLLAAIVLKLFVYYNLFVVPREWNVGALLGLFG